MSNKDCYGRGVVRGAVKTTKLIQDSLHHDPTRLNPWRQPRSQTLPCPFRWSFWSRWQIRSHGRRSLAASRLACAIPGAVASQTAPPRLSMEIVASGLQCTNFQPMSSAATFPTKERGTRSPPRRSCKILRHMKQSWHHQASQSFSTAGIRTWYPERTTASVKKVDMVGCPWAMECTWHSSATIGWLHAGQGPSCQLFMAHRVLAPKKNKLCASWSCSFRSCCTKTMPRPTCLSSTTSGSSPA